MLHPELAGRTDLGHASQAELRGLFACGVRAAVCFGKLLPRDSDPVPRYAREPQRWQDMEYTLDVHSRRLPRSAAAAAGALVLAGDFTVTTGGWLEQSGFNRKFLAERCSFWGERVPPKGYNEATGHDVAEYGPPLYFQSYRVSWQDGELLAGSELVEDYIPEDDTSEAWVKARNLAEDIGISSAESGLLATMTGEAVAYNMRARHLRLRSAMRIVLPF